jgi:hypothetical protein
MPRGRINNELRQMISVRYDVGLLRKVRELAEWKGIPYQTLMHLWVAERMNREWVAFQASRRRQNRRTSKIAERN